MASKTRQVWGKAAGSYNRSAPIPGVSGRRVPGSGRLPKARAVGGHVTHVPASQPFSMGSATFREYHYQQIRDSRGRFGGGWGFAWQGLQGLSENLQSMGHDLQTNTRAMAEKLAADMLEYAKQNAPWEDRTEEERARANDPPAGARESLQSAVVVDDADHFTIFIGHGEQIYYGIWLEVRWGGRYAIILPTVERFMAEIPGRLRTMT